MADSIFEGLNLTQIANDPATAGSVKAFIAEALSACFDLDGLTPEEICLLSKAYSDGLPYQVCGTYIEECGDADGEQALPLYEQDAGPIIRAAENGDAEAMVRYSWLLDPPDGVQSSVPPDKTKSFDWLRKAAEAGSADAMYQMGELYRSGKGPVPFNSKTAREWYVKALELGFDLAALSIELIDDKTRPPKARPGWDDALDIAKIINKSFPHTDPDSLTNKELLQTIEAVGLGYLLLEPYPEEDVDYLANINYDWFSYQLFIEGDQNDEYEKWR